MQFRKQVRNHQWQQQFLAKSLADRRLYVAAARRQSKSLTQRKAEDIMDVTPAAVEKMFVEYSVKTLVHGHTHRPARHQLAVVPGLAHLGAMLRPP